MILATVVAKCFDSPADNILQPTRVDTHQTMATVVAEAE